MQARRITERVLQYIWQFQYYNTVDLRTVEGLPALVLRPGTLNTHQGPDFLGAMIRLDGKLWAGNIEIHVRTSDWKRHRHSDDVNYRNVILHVVWQNDELSGADLPSVLELKERVPGLLLDRYEMMMKSEAFIPCAAQMGSVRSIVWEAWKERLLAERLDRRAMHIAGLLAENKHHWEETMWWMLARSFGMPVNAEPFEAMAKSIPYRLVLRYSGNIITLEALLLGQAGLLEADFTDKYMIMLQKEYWLIRKKHCLAKSPLPVHFLRMRPAGFPTIRLALLAMVIHTKPALMSFLLHTEKIKDVRLFLEVTANDYWHYRFIPDTPSRHQPKKTGLHLADHILINAIIPVLYTHGKMHRDENMIRKTVAWMSELPGERNSVTRKFVSAGAVNHSASCSQAFKELITAYCNQKKCLECAIGNDLLKRAVSRGGGQTQGCAS